jgi:predicted nuclease with TOPRIM domain
MAASTGDEKGPLGIAYTERSMQLYEARAALADVIQTLRDELQARRSEAVAFHADAAATREQVEAIRADQRALYEQAAAHAALIERLRDRNGELEAELDAVRAQLRSIENMRVIRWTAFPRQVLRRLRASK